MIIWLILGSIMLFGGRRLFWLFVASLGFLAGMQLASQVMGSTAPQGTLLAAGLVGGVLGASLAIFLQRFAVIAAGFLGGGWLCVNLLLAIGQQAIAPEWMLFIAGGVIGIVLVSTIFDYAIMVLSSVIGALAINYGLGLDGTLSIFAVIVLAGIGLGVQAGWLRSRR